MGYPTIEELEVWQAASELAVRTFNLTSRRGLGPHPGLRDQLERAVVSISNNIAEGYERGTTAELLTFLYYAKGSAGEVRSMLSILGRGDEWTSIRPEVDSLSRLTFSISRQLGAWVEKVKQSDSKGHRYQTPQAREERDRQARRDAFQAYLDQLQTEARQKWFSPPPPDPDASPPP